ncbi:PEP/pyruvate-binding domain-containing protein [Streptomyces sp. NPDC087422]|uniref:PEP/pyruvate-binding domain-containing protein n=1 Tax=Streptomyces sp. NPDC087422 TaxID=3365786 RepID=UPI0038197CA4
MRVDAEELAVVPLESPLAHEAALAGAKAANLARAAARGLPVLPGFALVPAARAPGAPAGTAALRRAWQELGGPDGAALVVRSSSAHEDTAESSMAGRFESVLDVRGWDAFTDAVRAVLDSAARVPSPPWPSAEDISGTGPGAGAGTGTGLGAGTGAGLGSAPGQGPGPGPGPDADDAAEPAVLPGDMAVLVQPMLRAAAGGVMFGADPVEGRYDRVLISAVPGGPDRLVDGSTQGVRYQLTRRGRLLRTEPAPSGHGRVIRLLARPLPGRRERRPEPGTVTARERQPLTRRQLVRLVRLARRAERVYGGPQDIEFGFADDGRLWLFQARPITAMAARPPRGARLLGPGPVSETLPGVLQPLEEDLWLAPMAHGLTLALDIAGAASRRRLRKLPVARTVEGRAAADLRLLGVTPPAHPVLHFINPAPGARRAAAAWRVGRLRGALPLLAQDLMADVDRQLHDFRAPRKMLSGELLNAVSWGRNALSALHAQESLAGALLDTGTLTGTGTGGGASAGTGGGTTAAGEALAVLAEGRGRGATDAELIAHHPVLLTLLPPTLGERGPLPEHVGWNGVPRGVGFLSVREGLRLRIRWVQEMQAAMVREIGTRMDAYCLVGERRKIALLRWDELLGVGAGRGRPADLAERTPRPETPPLPAAFRLADGAPQAVSLARGRTGRGQGEGQGAGGGQGAGTAWDGAGVRPPDAVLVVRSLDPALAPLLPGLSGLVAETGSVLSHLAVLAREYHVPTVVGVTDAVGRFAPGSGLAVDGGTGTVERTGGGTGAVERTGGGTGAVEPTGGASDAPGAEPGGSGDAPAPRDGRAALEARDEPRKGAVA